MTNHVWKTVDSMNKFIDFGRYAVLILNRPINIPQESVVDLWNKACYCATADGGTDRWYEFVSSLKKGLPLKQIHPDLASGDFDSIRPETLQRCRDNGVNVVRTPDQDQTDFTKTLEEIMKHNEGKIDSIVAVVENSGRLDHIMSNMNTLYNTTEIFRPPSMRLYLLSTESLTWLLGVGLHTIHVPHTLVQSHATCGLIPLGSPCIVSTKGLKWNLNKDKMEFGGLISTCNTYSETCGGIVTVETDSPLLWTMELSYGSKTKKTIN